MKARGILAACVFTFGTMLGTTPARAQTCRSLRQADVARCAVAASAAVRAEREGAAAAAGRKTAADPWIPSSPTLSLAGSQRSLGGVTVLNYHAALGQELELGGQRASRRRAADADVAARGHEVTATARKVAASAYVAWFDVHAARDASVLARRLESNGAAVAKAARARADAGVGSELEAEVAAAAALRAVSARVEAERLEALGLAQLAALVGLDPARESVVVEDDASPLDVPTHRAPHPEVRALQEESHAQEERAAGFRRARFPTVTVQIFAENDGFNERVLGAGIALPLPLPSPVGRTFAGEAEEADALSRQASARAVQADRQTATELAVAKVSYDAAKASYALYTEERLAKAERLLFDVAKEIEAGRLGVREALYAQQELVGLLRSRLDARRALALASVDLAVASGVALEATP